MATAGHSKAARAYYDHYRVSQIAQSVSLDFASDVADTSVIEGDSKTGVQGKTGGTCSINGLLDVADDGWDEIAFDDIQNDTHYITVEPQGNTITSLAYLTQQNHTGEGRAMDQANVGLLNWSGQLTGDFGRGQVITTGEKAFTGTGSDTGVNVGTTAATETALVVLHVTAFSGFTDVTFQIEESTDDGSVDTYAQITGWTIAVEGNASAGTDEVTFTGTGTAWLSMTAATETWKRVTVSAVNGTGSITVHGAACKSAV